MDKEPESGKVKGAFSKEAQMKPALRLMAEIGPYMAGAFALWQENCGRPLTPEEENFLWYCKAATATKGSIDTMRLWNRIVSFNADPMNM